MILSVDCILIDTFFKLTDRPPNFFYLRLILFALLPFGIMLVSTIFWRIKSCLTSLSAVERSDKDYSTVIIVMFLFYPTLVSYMSESVNCYDLEGVLRLYVDLEQQCYSGSHKWIVIFVSVPGILIWALGFPVLSL